MSDWNARVSERLDDFVARLFQWMRMRSISADPAYRAEIDAAAAWLVEAMRPVLGHAETVSEFGLPLAIGRTERRGDRPTVLVYGHYDVQPADRADGWSTDPFEPACIDGRLVGRGASDDKAPVMMILAALELLRERGELPVNVIMLIEGEEECSGHGVLKYVEAHRESLSPDLIVLSDTGGFSADRPAITYGTRGIVYKEIELVGPARDVHSGSFGGIVVDPNMAMAKLLAQLIDDSGRLNIAGLYDAVRPIGDDEHRQMAALNWNANDVCQSLATPSLIGESEYLPLERLGCRPSITINGVWGGYTGEGSKTVLPARAHAKLSVRLVPDQSAEVVSAQIDAALRSLVDPRVTLNIKTFGTADPFLGRRTGPAIDAATAAITEAFGVAPAMLREGGTLPILAFFQKHLTDNILPIGFSRPDCGAHGPSEYFHRDDFRRGIATFATLFSTLGSTLR
jgi:acetylornithine deacetylase/succinyl-diaminopimelate desuccinylase-like protein